MHLNESKFDSNKNNISDKETIRIQILNLVILLMMRLVSLRNDPSLSKKRKKQMNQIIRIFPQNEFPVINMKQKSGQIVHLKSTIYVRLKDILRNIQLVALWPVRKMSVIHYPNLSAVDNFFSSGEINLNKGNPILLNCENNSNLNVSMVNDNNETNVESSINCVDANAINNPTTADFCNFKGNHKRSFWFF